MEIPNRNIPPNFKQITDVNLTKVEIIKLKNGLPVHVINGGSQEITKFDLLIKAGAAYSNKNKLLAPITSLMLNEGTVNKNAQKIAEGFDYYGAHFNPVAEKDNAFVTLYSLNRHLKNTIPNFFDAVYNSNFPEQELKTVLHRRLNNFLIESEKTSFLARESFFEALFGKNHPYGMRSYKDLYAKLTQSEIIDFHKSQYKSGDFELIVSGMVTDDVIEVLDHSFGEIPILKSAGRIEVKLENAKKDLIVVDKPGAVQSSIRMGLQTIDKKHSDYLGLKILSTIFGGYFGSRLMKNIREEKGYTYGIHAMLVSLVDSGYLAVAADVKAENTKEAVEEIKNEMLKLQTSLVSAEEMALVRNYMMGELLQMFDGPLANSEAYKGVIQYGLTFSYFEKFKNEILNITPEKLQELAIRYLKIDELTVVVAGKY